jgi:hypothetical protein
VVKDFQHGNDDSDSQPVLLDNDREFPVQGARRDIVYNSFLKLDESLTERVPVRVYLVDMRVHAGKEPLEDVI